MFPKTLRDRTTIPRTSPTFDTIRQPGISNAVVTARESIFPIPSSSFPESLFGWWFDNSQRQHLPLHFAHRIFDGSRRGASASRLVGNRTPAHSGLSNQ